MRENKFKGQTSARKVVASVFWDCEGILYMEFLERGAATNSERYVHTWKKLKKTILKSSAKQGEESNPYTSYSPELAPPDFHIFGPLKDTLWGRRLVDDEVLNTACMRNFDASAYSLMRSAYSVSCKGGKTVDNEEQFVEKYSQLCEWCINDMHKSTYNCNYSFLKNQEVLFPIVSRISPQSHRS